MGDETLEDFLDELRKFRDSYAERFNFDMDAIYEDLKRQERESGREYVSFPAKRIVPTVDIPVVDSAEPVFSSQPGLTTPQEDDSPSISTAIRTRPGALSWPKRRPKRS